MIRETKLTVSRFENSDATWSAVVTLVEHGALALTPKIIAELDPQPYGFWTRAIEGSPELLNIRAVLEAIPGLQVREYVGTIWEAADFAAADLLKIVGVDLEMTDPPLFDEREFPPSPACGTCGNVGFGRVISRDWN